MAARTTLVLLLIAGQWSLAAEPAPTDLHGDPLPVGAQVRLGTTRWRASNTIIYSRFVDNSTAMTIANDHLVQFWDIEKGRVVRSVDVSNRPAPTADATPSPIALSAASTAVSEDGKRLAIGRSSTVRIWDLEAGKQLREINLSTPNISRMAISPDGSRLAIAGSDRRVALYSTIEDREPTWLENTGENGSQISYRLEFSPDGKQLLLLGLDIVGNVVPVAKRWDLTDVKKAPSHLSLPPEFSSTFISRAALSADHAHIAGVQGASVCLVDVKGGQATQTFAAPGIDIRARLAFSPDNKRLVLFQAPGELIRVWDIATKKMLSDFGVTPGRRPTGVSTRIQPQLSVSPDGRTLLAPQDGTLLFVNLEDGRIRNEVDGHLGGIRWAQFSADGKTIVTRGADYALRSWDAKTGRPTGRIAVSPLLYSYACSPDGRWLQVGERTGPIRVYDTFEAREHFTAATDSTSSLGQLAVFSPNSQILGCVGRNSPIVSLYDLPTGNVLRQIRLPEIIEQFDEFPRRASIGRTVMRRLWFSPDSRLVAVSSGTSLTVWECATGRLAANIQLSSLESQHQAAIAPDGRSVAVETADGQVTFWEIASASKRFALPKDDRSSFPRTEISTSRVVFDPAGPPTTMAFSPDGRLLAHSHPDRSVRVWDVWNRTELAALRGHTSPPLALAFDPTGRRLVSGSGDSTALVWDLQPHWSSLKELDAKEAGSVESHWKMLISNDAATAYRAIQSLSSNIREAMPFLREHLKPAKGPDDGQMAALIGDLSHPKFSIRAKAQRELAALGEAAANVLYEAIRTSASPEVRRLAKRILESLTFSEIAPEEIRALRAIEALETANTEESVKLLKDLAVGATVSIPTFEARRSLERLKKANE